MAGQSSCRSAHFGEPSAPYAGGTASGGWNGCQDCQAPGEGCQGENLAALAAFQGAPYSRSWHSSALALSIPLKELYASKDASAHTLRRAPRGRAMPWSAFRIGHKESPPAGFPIARRGLESCRFFPIRLVWGFLCQAVSTPFLLCFVIPFFCSTRAASILSSRPHISVAVARSGSQGRRFFSAAEGLSLTDASTAASCRRSGGWPRDDPRGACYWPRAIAREPRLYSVEPI
jgi:hypothetical protein